MKAIARVAGYGTIAFRGGWLVNPLAPGRRFEHAKGGLPTGGPR